MLRQRLRRASKAQRTHPHPPIIHRKRSTVCGLQSAVFFSAPLPRPSRRQGCLRDRDESRPRKRRALAALHIWTAVTRHRSQHLDSSRCASRSRVSPTISNRLQSAVCGLRSAVSRSPHPPNRVGAKPLYAAKPRGGEAPLRGKTAWGQSPFTRQNRVGAKPLYAAHYLIGQPPPNLLHFQS